MRETEYLKQRYAAILRYVGLILMLASALMLTPLLALPGDRQEIMLAPAFLVPAAATGLCGFLLRKIFRPSSYVTLSVQEGGVIVLISWVMVILFSAWPFMWARGLNFSQACFESMSGWTTTGLSVVDVTRAGMLVLLWRSIIQLAGGAGLAIIMMSAIVGPTGVGISSAEGRGDQLVPHVRQSARLVLFIYSGYALVGVLALQVSGMSWFDAVNHSFAAVSTGGFGTHPESIGYWDSPAVEAVILVLMVLGNLSFVTAWLLWRGDLKSVARNGEVRLQAVLIPICSAAVLMFTSRMLFPQMGKAVRVAVFECVSALTTTGFSTVSYNNWNGFGVAMLIILMLIGGGTCSTAGGIKQFRIYFLWKLLVWEIKRAMMPRWAVQERPIWEGNRRVFVDDGRARQVTVFVFLYMATYAVGTMILCASGFSLSDSLFEFASAIGTVGLSIGVTSPQTPLASMWAETAAMFLGRLEFIVIIVSLLKIGHDVRLAMMPNGRKS